MPKCPRGRRWGGVFRLVNQGPLIHFQCLERAICKFKYWIDLVITWFYPVRLVFGNTGGVSLKKCTCNIIIIKNNKTKYIFKLMLQAKGYCNLNISKTDPQQFKITHFVMSFHTLLLKSTGRCFLSFNLLYYKCAVPFLSIFCSVPGLVLCIMWMFSPLSVLLSLCMMSCMSNERWVPIFITCSCTCLESLHYNNYSYWKSDHRPNLNPSHAESRGDQNPWPAGSQDDWPGKWWQSCTGWWHTVPHGAFLVHLFMLAQARLTAVCCSPNSSATHLTSLLKFPNAFAWKYPIFWVLCSCV